MNVPVFEVSKPDEIDHLIANAAKLELPWRVELYRAVRNRKINLIELDRNAEAPMRHLETSVRPIAVLIGDDDYASTGPTGWVSFRRLGYWARGALVHATGGDVASYKMAIGLTLIHRRFLLIETSSSRAHEWGAALQKRQIQAVGLVPPSGAHPVLPPRGAMQ